MFKKTIFLGIFGMLIIITALLSTDLPTQRILFFLGAALMTSMALLEDHKLFIGLQLVILSGTITAFFNIPKLIEAAIPLLVSLPVIYYLFKKNIINNKVHLIGVLALVGLGMGYATQSLMVFFLSGLFICTFSFLEFISGFRPAIIWLILNLIFTLISGMKLFL